MALNEFSERLVAKEQHQNHECAVNACTHILTKSFLALTGPLALPAPGCRSSHNGNGRILAYRMPVLQGVLHTGSTAMGGAGDITRNWQAWHSPHGWGMGVAFRVLHSLMEMHMWCFSLCIDASFECRQKYLSGPKRLQRKEWEKTFLFLSWPQWSRDCICMSLACMDSFPYLSPSPNFQLGQTQNNTFWKHRSTFLFPTLKSVHRTDLECLSARRIPLI